MRTSTFQIYSQRQRLAQLRLDEYVHAQRQVATGKKMEKLSDSPLDATLLLKTKTIQRHYEQYQSNLKVGQVNLKASEGILAEVSELLKRAQTIAISGANESLDQQGRNALAGEVRVMRDRMVSLANSQSADGRYLFGGQITDSAPYTNMGSSLTYNGDNNPLFIEVGSMETMKINVEGGATFTDTFDVLQDLITRLEGGDQSALSGISINEVKAEFEKFGSLRADVGYRLRSIEERQSDFGRRIEELTGKVSDIEDVDLAEAITRLQRSQVSYEAALQVSSQTYRLSLLDYLR